MAGLLARPVSEAFPFAGWQTVAKDFQKHFMDLQLRVQLPIFTRFPFRIVKRINSTINRNRFTILRFLIRFCLLEL